MAIDLAKRSDRRVAAVVFFSLMAVSVFAAEPEAVLQRSRQLEAATMSLLAEQFRFEENLLSPDSDRVAIFLSVPHGARVIINQVNLRLDGESVHTYTYSASELLSFQQRSAQLLYVGRIPPGRHVLRLEVTTMQGTVKPMKDYVFVKEDKAKFVDLQLVGYQVREVFASDW